MDSIENYYLDNTKGFQRNSIRVNRKLMIYDFEFFHYQRKTSENSKDKKQSNHQFDKSIDLIEEFDRIYKLINNQYLNSKVQFQCEPKSKEQL